MNLMQVLQLGVECWVLVNVLMNLRNMRWISRISELSLAAREVPCSMEWVETEDNPYLTMLYVPSICKFWESGCMREAPTGVHKRVIQWGVYESVGYPVLVDWLLAGQSGIESRWGARFFAHFQTGPEAHPASCTMGTGSCPGVKRPGRGAHHPPPSIAEVKKE
jgi:hypothetical protein